MPFAQKNDIFALVMFIQSEWTPVGNWTSCAEGVSCPLCFAPFCLPCPTAYGPQLGSGIRDYRFRPVNGACLVPLGPYLGGCLFWVVFLGALHFVYGSFPQPPSKLQRHCKRPVLPYHKPSHTIAQG